MAKGKAVRQDGKTDDLRTRFEGHHKIYEALREEVVFILNSTLEESGLKIHQIESRIKTFDSLSRKMSTGSYVSIDEIVDIVGARVVCLFKSDIDALSKIIRSSFNVLDTDNKIDVSADSFGYMSVHFVCKMRDDYSGPRYGRIGQQVFEIQLRTICMHAWAVISHYLDYKTEWDIPLHLRKGLNALSGLFYVADSQYEQLYRSREESRSLAEGESAKDAKLQAINLDTVTAMLRRIFPNRINVDPAALSIFVRELLDNAYENVGDVETKIRSGLKSLAVHEGEISSKYNLDPSKPYFADLGAARTILQDIHEGYKMRSFSTFDDDE